jgi:DNA-binding transcriptional ArsR family regulator
MTTDAGTGEATGLSPDEAFGVLGEETRLGILRALGDAEAPLSFSELFDRIDYDTTANFSYHLGKLEGHFVERTGDGYALRQAGQRVVEAVLSGAVTDAPVVERTRIDRSCQHCGGSPVEVEYTEEQLGVYCTQCAGQYGGSNGTEGEELPAERERIGYLYLPPAGTRGRTPAEMVEAAHRWTVLQAQSLHRGVCPRCSASVDHSIDACGNHDPAGDPCERCDRRYAVGIDSRCTNCPFALGGSAVGYLHTSPDLLGFLFDHGFDPLSSAFPSTLEVADFEEELVGTDPFEARFTFAVDGDTLTLRMTEDLTVTAVTES